jgi:O-antigen/teichoic acid export membrane protein
LLQKSNWPDHLLLWFVPILILEHLNQEVSRLLTALSEQLTSSVILFVRQGSWSLAAIGVMSVDSSARNLGTIIPLWVMAGVAALSIGVWKLKQLKTQGWNLPIDWSWIKKGIGVSAAFLLASLALRGLQTFDRYWLEDLGGIQMVGSYVLMQGIASVLMIFLEATLFAFAFPKLINLNYEGRSQEAQQQVRQMLFQTVLVAILFSIISWLLLPYFLKWIGNPIYIQALPLYPWVLSAAVINTLSMVPNLALYARGRDKPIIYSNVCALIVFVAVTWLLSGTQGSLAVIFGVNTAFFCILSWQSIAYLLLVKQENSIRK